MSLLAAVSASTRCTAIFRVAEGCVEECSLDADAREQTWTQWSRAPFDESARAVAAISGWDEHIEVFILDVTGHVWNRWWWAENGWAPTDRFNSLGAPFSATDARDLVALSAGAGHFNVFVEAVDGRLAMLPHLLGPDGAQWYRCHGSEQLGDGWWPAFHNASLGGYRNAPTGSIGERLQD